jgi:hypothetical protein
LELEPESCARSDRTAQRPHTHPAYAQVHHQCSIPLINVDHSRSWGRDPAAPMLAPFGGSALGDGYIAGDLAQRLGEGLKGQVAGSPGNMTQASCRSRQEAVAGQ